MASIQQSIVPRGLKMWHKNIGFLNRVKIQAYQCVQYPLKGLNTLPGKHARLERMISGIDRKIHHIQVPRRNSNIPSFPSSFMYLSTLFRSSDSIYQALKEGLSSDNQRWSLTSFCIRAATISANRKGILADPNLHQKLNLSPQKILWVLNEINTPKVKMANRWIYGESEIAGTVLNALEPSTTAKVLDLKYLIENRIKTAVQYFIKLDEEHRQEALRNLSTRELIIFKEIFHEKNELVESIERLLDNDSITLTSADSDRIRVGSLAIED